ncbi:MAG: hypothetical protein PHY47_21910 [Lachnospiraceae bacterium]|nr:hypothetical protein [Lachnospiraceae bacterium]
MVKKIGKAILGTMVISSVIFTSLKTEAKELVESENWQWEADGIVYRPYTDAEVATWAEWERTLHYNSDPDRQGKKAVPLSSLSDAEKLAILSDTTSGLPYSGWLGEFYEMDMDLIIWFLNSPFDVQTKYNYFNSLQKTPSEVYQWVINAEELTDVQKQVYLRGHSISNISPELQEWWYQTIGKPLTTEETTAVDGRNYAAYRWNQNRIRANGGSWEDGTKTVQDSNKKTYIMASEDFEDAMASGLIASWWLSIRCRNEKIQSTGSISGVCRNICQLSFCK